MKLLTYAISIIWLACAAAFAGNSAELGAGKALNNTNAKLPGWAYSARLAHTWDRWSAEAAYTRLGASQLGANAAFSTVGVGYRAGRVRYGFSIVTGASYDAAVWWDSRHPLDSCGVEGCGREYANDGKHFSRACHLCGGSLSASYALTRHAAIRAEYFGIRRMCPTFQGAVVQFTYSIGNGAGT